jgi:hypothetical protein
VKDVETFLAELNALGVKLWGDGDHLRLRAPEGALTAGSDGHAAEAQTGDHCLAAARTELPVKSLAPTGSRRAA